MTTLPSYFKSYYEEHKPEAVWERKAERAALDEGNICIRCKERQRAINHIWCRTCLRKSDNNRYYRNHKKRLALGEARRERLAATIRLCSRCKKAQATNKHDWCTKCQREYHHPVS